MVQKTSQKKSLEEIFGESPTHALEGCVLSEWGWGGFHMVQPCIDSKDQGH